jgi:hypothetical protein
MGYSAGGAGTELITRVRAAAQGTPFAVILTPNGFDVTADIATPQWQGLLYRQNVRQVFIHHVSLNERTKQLTVTSEQRVLEWHSGVRPGAPPVPYLGGSFSKFSGRVIHKSFVKTYGEGEDGRFGKLEEYRFSSEEGRRLILDAAAALGWTVERGRHEKIGIIAAVIGLGIALIVVLGLLLVFVLALVLG